MQYSDYNKYSRNPYGRPKYIIAARNIPLLLDDNVVGRMEYKRCGIITCDTSGGLELDDSQKQLLYESKIRELFDYSNYDPTIGRVDLPMYKIPNCMHSIFHICLTDEINIVAHPAYISLDGKHIIIEDIKASKDSLAKYPMGKIPSTYKQNDDLNICRYTAVPINYDGPYTDSKGNPINFPERGRANHYNKADIRMQVTMAIWGATSASYCFNSSTPGILALGGGTGANFSEVRFNVILDKLRMWDFNHGTFCNGLDSNLLFQ